MPPLAGIKYNKTVLPNGLRVVTEKLPAVRSASIGIWVDAGSRDENEHERGISHFIEHMLFKGTKNRTAKQIAVSIESLGGSINAFTSREQTCFYALVLDEHLDAAVDVIADILMNSRMTEANIEREKQVVTEEIREVIETPSDHIHELFAETFWRGQSLGQPIMGTEKSVKSFNRRKLIDFIGRHYKSGRIVIAAAGNVSHKKLVAIIKDKLDFSKGDDNRNQDVVSPTDPKVQCYANGGNQVHLCLGFPGVKFSHSTRFGILCLNTYLGGGMSSVLFQKIREDKGMAYTVFTYTDFYRDAGILGVYLATDRIRSREAVEIILREMGKLKKTKLAKSKLEMVKAQIKGNLTLGMESTSGRMNRMGRYELMAGKYVSLHDALKRIDKITADDLIKAARAVFSQDRITVTSLGPLKEKDLESLKWSLVK